jgi:hypothetical protein
MDRRLPRDPLGIKGGERDLEGPKIGAFLGAPGEGPWFFLFHPLNLRCGFI